MAEILRIFLILLMGVAVFIMLPEICKPIFFPKGYKASNFGKRPGLYQLAFWAALGLVYLVPTIIRGILDLW
ncbi:hypothetical protein A2619_02990 [candidate division WWE3 bacterium RIFOXYD1_FULL_39_9]|uniref:Uncharacterized protein n=1 Tax=candidate division WWE3 bacterium RIFOXYD1_FULL_39_9 TaxID=1802649 RepID=A0A1F4X8M0_UNCKA|nr:MAG: hypothetical protein A2619_02990 [candidate division WWE3 bacterium RIFOXYD1_FULL_39_9]